MTRDPAWDFADHVCRTGFDDLPEATREATRQDLLDTFGCLLGGSAAPGIDTLSRVLGRWGGAEEASVLLLDRRLPAPQAAMMHGAMAHALDYDDTLDNGGSIHPGASVLGAVLATADMIGGVTGRDALAAAALGLDVSCRVALASTVDRGWHRTASMGVFGAAVAAGRLLGLDPARMRHALGIAYSQAAGNRQCITDGALTKRLQAGQAAAGGVFAAVLAREDFTGAENVFCGRFGFLELYQPGGHDAARLTADLGTRFGPEQLSFKPYPCGRPQHALIDAALAARAQLGLDGDPDRIAAVTVTTDAATIANEIEAGPHKRRPTQIVEAQFALPFLLATALLRGRVGIDELADLSNGSILSLADRVTATPGAPAAITVTTRDGGTAVIPTGIPLGAPENRLGIDRLREKFADCAAHAVRPIPRAVVEETADRLLRLDTLADLREVFRPFTG